MQDFELRQPRTGASFHHWCNSRTTTAERQMQALRAGRHPHKALQAAFQADPVGWMICTHETPMQREHTRLVEAARGAKVATQAEGASQSSAGPPPQRRPRVRGDHVNSARTNTLEFAPFPRARET